MDGALRAPGLMADIVQVLVALINGNGQKDNNQKKRPLDETLFKSEPADGSTGTGAERQEWLPPPAAEPAE